MTIDEEIATARELENEAATILNEEQEKRKMVERFFETEQGAHGVKIIGPGGGDEP